MNVLDVTMNLNTGTREPYNKPNNNLLYININSNHLSEIIKNLPENIQKRISKLSSSTRIFSNSKDIYNNDLSANGFQQRFKFEQGNTSATPIKTEKGTYVSTLLIVPILPLKLVKLAICSDKFLIRNSKVTQIL